MLLLSPPSSAQIDSFLERARHSTFTYAEVGRTSGELPSGYNLDRNRVQLGSGIEVWQRAVAAVRQWKMHEMDWIRLYRPSTPISTGENVVVCAHCFGVYFLNACRIVYTIDADGPVKTFGFAYGTLQDHAGSGEERFLVEWEQQSNEVWYDLRAFSRPRQLLARAGYPFARGMQKRFAEDSKAAMVSAVRVPL